MSDLKVDKSMTIPLGFQTTVGTLKDTLSVIPDHAQVSVQTSLGDRPWESDTHSLHFAWTETVYAERD